MWTRASKALSTITLFLGAMLLAAQALAGHKGPDFPETGPFLDQVTENWKALGQKAIDPPSAGKKITTGSVEYFPLRLLIRGQKEISVDNIGYEKFASRLGDDFEWKKGSWRFNHDHGRSSVSIDDPISVVKGPQGYVIIDGHHDFYLALFLGAETIAASVKEDLSKLDPVDFWREMKKRDLVYLDEAAEALALAPPKTEKIRDNPNRFLATLLALKVGTKTARDGSPQEIVSLKGAERPVWIKHNDGVPFVEFYIAAVLSDAGIRYESDWGKHVPSHTIEDSRKALLKAKRSGKYPLIANIPVIETDQESEHLVKHPKALLRFLRSQASGRCEAALLTEKN